MITLTEKKVMTLVMTQKNLAVDFIIEAYKSRAIDMMEALRLNRMIKKYFNLTV